MSALQKPRYQQVKDLIIQRISTGELRPADRVPSENELVEARETLPHAKQVEEFGDLMFVMANLARHLDIDPEEALRHANRKFTRRFASIEDALGAKGKTPAQSTLEEMDALWDQAKAAE